MSSKWGRYPTPRLRPAICASFAGSCLPPSSIQYPPRLIAYIVWVDLDPLDPIKGVGWAYLYPERGTHIYNGISAQATVRVAAEIRPVDSGWWWYINTKLYYHHHEPANWTWGAHFVNPDVLFNTGLLIDTVLPGLDFKEVWISA